MRQSAIRELVPAVVSRDRRREVRYAFTRCALYKSWRRVATMAAALAVR